MKIKNYQKIAQEIISEIGADNIVSLTYCATRLRVVVKDKEQIDEEKLKRSMKLKEPSVSQDVCSVF